MRSPHDSVQLARLSSAYGTRNQTSETVAATDTPSVAHTSAAIQPGQTQAGPASQKVFAWACPKSYARITRRSSARAAFCSCSSTWALQARRLACTSPTSSRWWATPPARSCWHAARSPRLSACCSSTATTPGSTAGAACSWPRCSPPWGSASSRRRAPQRSSALGRSSPARDTAWAAWFA